MPRTFDALSQYGTCFRSNFEVQKAYEFFEFSRPKNKAYVVSILAFSCSLNLLWIGDGQIRSLKRMDEENHKQATRKSSYLVIVMEMFLKEVEQTNLALINVILLQA